jgi:hypothetical protein
MESLTMRYASRHASASSGVKRRATAYQRGNTFGTFLVAAHGADQEDQAVRHELGEKRERCRVEQVHVVDDERGPRRGEVIGGVLERQRGVGRRSRAYDVGWQQVCERTQRHRRRRARRHRADGWQALLLTPAAQLVGETVLPTPAGPSKSTPSLECSRRM